MHAANTYNVATATGKLAALLSCLRWPYSLSGSCFRDASVIYLLSTGNGRFISKLLLEFGQTNPISVPFPFCCVSGVVTKADISGMRADASNLITDMAEMNGKLDLLIQLIQERDR